MIFILDSILQVLISSSELPYPDLYYQINVCMYVCMYVCRPLCEKYPGEQYPECMKSFRGLTNPLGYDV